MRYRERAARTSECCARKKVTRMCENRMQSMYVAVVNCRLSVKVHGDGRLRGALGVVAYVKAPNKSAITIYAVISSSAQHESSGVGNQGCVTLSVRPGLAM